MGPKKPPPFKAPERFNWRIAQHFARQEHEESPAARTRLVSVDRSRSKLDETNSVGRMSRNHCQDVSP